MIIIAILNGFLHIITFVFSNIVQIPLVNDISNILTPYVNFIGQYLIAGASFISFFIPMDLMQTLIPIIISIELALEALDIVKFVLRIFGSNI